MEFRFVPQRSDRLALGATVTKAVTRIERKEATRLQILLATIDMIAEGGLSDLTLTKITDKANVSRGLVNFHFDHKEKLLVDTLRHLTEEYRASWQRAIASAGPDPAARLLALVNNDFHSSICNRRKVAVWFAFRGESRSRPTYLDVCNQADDEFVAMVTGVFEALKAEGGYGFDSRRAANGLGALVEGLWLDCLMYPDDFRREDAIATALLFLHALMPKHFPDGGPGM
jgi:TetR/AcrR family transcriptional repressor of bet genes